MRYLSKERAKEERQARPLRLLFLAEFRWCWFCGVPHVTVHEIACGSHRRKAYGNRITWAAACWDCNSNHLTDNGPNGEWPIARQLAVKKINDPLYYKRVEFNVLRGTDPEAITAGEVYRWVRKELRRG